METFCQYSKWACHRSKTFQIIVDRFGLIQDASNDLGKKLSRNNIFRPGSQQRQLWPQGRFSVFLVRRWQVFPCKKKIVKFPRLNSRHPYERKLVERCVRQATVFNSQELKARFYSSEVKSFRRAFIFSVQNVFLGLSEIFIGDFHPSFPQCHQTCLSTDSLKL